jgi:hypothetical protein
MASRRNFRRNSGLVGNNRELNWLVGLKPALRSK